MVELLLNKIPEYTYIIQTSMPFENHFSQFHAFALTELTETNVKSRRLEYEKQIAVHSFSQFLYSSCSILTENRLPSTKFYSLETISHVISVSSDTVKQAN